MRKKLVIILWISLVILIFAFGSLVVYQNKQEKERLAEAARIEAQKEAEEQAVKEAEMEDEGQDEEEYTFTDFEATYYAKPKSIVREEPFDTAEVIGTLSIDQRVSIVAKCNQSDYYKIKINGDYGYMAFTDVSEEYIDIPLPTGDKGIPTASKEILFMGNSITFYPPTKDWWGGGYGCGATNVMSDYVHLTVAAKGYTSFDVVSVRDWEKSSTRNNDLTVLDDFITNYQYDTIVIQLGENVKGHEAHFEEDLTDMIKYIRTFNPNARIVMLDNFWKYSGIISTKKAVAAATGCTYVSLADIQGVDEYMLQEGDHYTALDGTEYVIGSFLAGHPNDAGFVAIEQHLVPAL